MLRANDTDQSLVIDILRLDGWHEPDFTDTIERHLSLTPEQ